MDVEHRYYADGSLKSTHTAPQSSYYVHDPKFDRAFTYDYVGRLKEAYSGSEAQAFLNGTPHTGTATGPYRQTYQYDAWDNITRRDTRFWSRTDTHTATYTDGKRQAAGWLYDATGNLKVDETVSYTYDAAGRNATLENLADARKLTKFYDGDGQIVKQVEREAGVESATYYLYSTMLGGRAVTKIDTNGNKAEGYVYVNGTRLAKHYPGINGGSGSVVWEHANPVAGKGGESDKLGRYWLVKETDPMGVDLGTYDPFITINEYVEPEAGVPSLLPTAGGGGGSCTLDGMAHDCADLAERMETGAVAAEFLIHDGRGYRVENVPIVSHGLGIFSVSRWVSSGRSTSNGSVFNPERGEWEDNITMHSQRLETTTFYFAQQTERRLSLNLSERFPFTDNQKKILKEVEDLISRPGCQEWFNKTVNAMLPKNRMTSMGLLLKLTTFNRFSESVTAADMGVDETKFKGYAERSKEGRVNAITPDVRGNRNVWIFDVAFNRSLLGMKTTTLGHDLFDFGENRDTATTIVHELFRRAGLFGDRIEKLDKEIQKHCGIVGYRY